MPLPNTFLVIINYGNSTTAAKINLPKATENNKGQVIIFHSNVSYDATIAGPKFYALGGYIDSQKIYYNSLTPTDTFTINNYVGEAIFQCVGTRGWVVIRYHSV